MNSLEDSLSSEKRNNSVTQAQIQKLGASSKVVDNRNTSLEVDLAVAEDALKNARAQIASRLAMEKVLCKEAHLMRIKSCVNTYS